MNTKLKFAFEKETKGAVRYQEVGEDGAPAFAPQVGTLYIRKCLFRLGQHKRHDAVPELGADPLLLNLAGKPEAARVMADVILGVQRRRGQSRQEPCREQVEPG